MSKKNELRELTPEELQAKYRHFKEELFNLRFQLATGQLENVARIKTVRRNIARVMTYLHQAQGTVKKAARFGEAYLPPRSSSRRSRSSVASRRGTAVEA